MRLRALAALIPIVPIVIGALLLSGGGPRSGARANAVAGLTYTSIGPAPAKVTSATLPAGSGNLVAEVLRKTAMRASPGGHSIATIGTRTQFGGPDVVSVVRVDSGWLGVLSEYVGNGRLGWIPESDTQLGRNAFVLRASLSAKTLTVFDGSKMLEHYTIGDGATWAPTPTGTFAVTDRLVTGDPEGPYGCCIVALSAIAPHTIPGWTGGDRIAIHATPDTETIGEPDSHGCVHLTNAEARWLVYHVPIGSRVVVTG
jgi:lipoprotein-anchoring transpeptidase ErfK/SrfK